MKEKVKRTVGVLLEYLKELKWRITDDDVMGLSAEMTYYLVLAFFPFLLFVINLLSFTEIADQAMVLEFNQYLPESTAELIEEVVGETFRASSGWLLVTSMLGTLWAASKGMRAIIKGLNRAYDVEEGRPIWRLILVSVGFVAALAVLIVLSMFFLVFGEMIGSAVFTFLGMPEAFIILWSVLRYVISLAMMFIIFVLLYHFGPNEKIHYSNVVIGAVFSILGWLVVSQGFSFYVRYFGNYQKIYGSLGGIIVFLLWIYLNSMIILIGGELNRITANMRQKNKTIKGKYRSTS